MIDKDGLIAGFSRVFLEEFKYNLKREQFCFIDNSVDENNEASEHEKIMFAQSLEEIINFTKGNEPFFCKDIKEIST